MSAVSTITAEQQDRIREFVMGHHLHKGLGTESEACSIAAINLVILGELTDSIPDCMSPVIGKWIIGVQDAMPDVMRNGFAWKSALPLAAGTGRDPEKEAKRLALILEWMWATVLPTVQPIADKHGFGAEWRTMLTERTEQPEAEAAEAARAARAAATAWAAEAAEAARAAEAAEAAAWAAEAAEAAWASWAPAELLRQLIEA
jgi:hypothetical protein